ncbi:hypothetical protein [Vibrio splendidus]|uniref:hypothetical protein n=1 Tax=Vibrio splendidus TaxID=29497 RepID=UPI000C8498B4|nr:hypothetical protein [Vibrio splendidus]PMH10120.1 hypothetical protein BCU75_10770 [Vibrio splendidus]
MIFSLLNTRFFPCPRTHKYHFDKFSSGFVNNGYTYLEVNDLESILLLGEDDILYISNHFSCDFTHRLFKRQLQDKLYYYLSRSVCKLVFWNFHTTFDTSVWQEFSYRSVHLGEDMDKEYLKTEDALVKFQSQYDIYRLKYSSNHEIKPSYTQKRDFDFQFVGSNYKSEWTKHCDKKYNSFVRITPPVINEVERINSYRKSEINLVFHSEANIKKGIIVERFAEAISLGGIIFHDHPKINQLFPNVDSFFYIKSIGDIDKNYKHITGMQVDEITALRKASRECWEISNLSYQKQASSILKKLGALSE